MVDSDPPLFLILNFCSSRFFLIFTLFPIEDVSLWFIFCFLFYLLNLLVANIKHSSSEPQVLNNNPSQDADHCISLQNLALWIDLIVRLVTEYGAAYEKSFKRHESQDF